MAVTSSREVTGRSLAHKFGEAPTAERRFVVTLDSTDTPTQDIINYPGIFHLAPHPEFPFLLMTSASVAEATPTPYHAEVTYQYDVLKPEEQDPNPLARPDVWSFSTSGAAIAALTYYEGSGNNDRRALVNSAKDYFEGLQTEEAEVRATIQANRPVFPLALAAQVTNCVNSDAYLGAPPHFWKCAGISAQRATEVVNDVEIQYWQLTTELVYRQTGWDLVIPDVGYNYIDPASNTKQRAYVIDPDDGVTKIPCANPVALQSNGNILGGNTAPALLTRRVYKEVEFASLFGQPPS